MPKKSTRRNTARPRPKLPEGDEGKDLDPQDKADKLNLYIQDFDEQVNEKLASFQSAADLVVRRITAMYKMAVLGLPKDVRDMKVSDFLKNGGQINNAAVASVEHEIDQLVNTCAAKVTSGGKARARQEAASSDENTSTITKTTKKGRARNPTRKCLGANTSMSNQMPPPPTATRTSRRTAASRQNQFQTPSAKGGPAAHGWETPVVTPKFDPRLPFTPSTSRKFKPGEKLMSMAGSPVASADRPEAIFPMGDGMVTISANTNLDDIDVLDMDVDTLQQMEKITKILSGFIQNHSKSTTADND